MTGVATGAVHDVLAASQLPAAAELSLVLQAMCGGNGVARLTSLRKLKTNVYRAQFETADELRSLVLKSTNPAVAHRNLLVARRWLPAMGLPHAAARLAGSAAERHGELVWLIYEDLGASSLDGTPTDRARVAAAVDLIAELHMRSAGHAVLPDCRAHGSDLGAAYLVANVRDAVRGLELLRPPRIAWTEEQEPVRDRLLTRLRLLQHELPERIRLLEQRGGPEVLLHGDLWTTNTFVLDGPGGLRAVLVDWDRAGVGRASYDLSTFLLRYPDGERGWILDRYRSAVAAAGWRLPEAPVLNALFETAEYARYANRVIWPTVAHLVDGAPWAFDELKMIASWFDDLQPVIPEPAQAAVR
jgi:hypothetical protein